MRGRGAGARPTGPTPARPESSEHRSRAKVLGEPDIHRAEVASTESEPREGRSEAVAVGELYRAHARFVAGLLTKLGARREDVEDVVQEVFLIAHRRGGFVPGAAKPTTWLGEIAVRVWSNWRRSQRRKPLEPAGDLASEAGGSDPERAASAQRALSRVQRCLEALDLEHRTVFVLFELEGQSGADIAAALGVPVGTVHRRLHTARKRFRESYGVPDEVEHG